MATLQSCPAANLVPSRLLGRWGTIGKQRCSGAASQDEVGKVELRGAPAPFPMSCPGDQKSERSSSRHMGGPPQEETHFLHFCHSPSVTTTGPGSNDWSERWGLSWAVSNDVPGDHPVPS
jgi:hypothetical protein